MNQPKTLEEIQLLNKWLVGEVRRLQSVLDGKNKLIDELENTMDNVREALEYCSEEGRGTYSQQHKARMALVDMDMHVQVDRSNKKELQEIREAMSEHTASFDGTLGRYNRIIGRAVDKVPMKRSKRNY